MYRLSQLEVECGQIHAVLTHKAGFYSNQTVTKLMIQASALTDFLNEVKVGSFRERREGGREGGEGRRGRKGGERRVKVGDD